MAADGTIILETKIDESGIKSGLSSLKSGLGTVVKTFAAVSTAALGMTVAIAKGAKETSEYGDRVDKLSQKIGMSKESFQQWDYIMQINGASIETLQTSMKTLSTAAQNGSDAFTKLGLSEEYVQTASPEDLFETTIGKLQEMGEGTERTAIASKLLGRSATELAPLLNSEASSIEELKQQAIDYGMVMSDEAVSASAAFSDSLTTLGMTATGLKNKLMAEFLPALTNVTDGLALLFKGDTSGLNKIKDGVSELVEKISSALPKVIEVGGELVMMLGQAIMDNLPKLLSSGANVISSFAQAIISALPNLVTIIVSSLPTMIPILINGIVQIIVILANQLPNIIQPIIDNLPIIVTAIADAIINNVPLLIQASIQLVAGIVKAFPSIIASLLKAVADLAKKIGDVLFNSLPQPVQNAFKKAWEAVKAVWDVVSPYFKTVWENIKIVFSVAKDVLGAYFSAAWEAIKAVWDVVSGYFKAVWDTIAGIFSVVKAVLSGNWSDAWEAIKGIVGTWAGFFNTVWNSIKSIFSAAVGFFRTTFSSAWNGIKAAFANVGAFFADVWAKIKGAFKFGEMGAIGKNIVTGLWNGIQATKDWLLGKIKSWCGSILNAMKSFFGIHSPALTIKDQVGLMIGEGMAVGILASKWIIQDAMENLVDYTITEAKRVIETMNDDLLESEKLYAAESLRIEREREEAEYQERVAAAKDAEELAKIENERLKKIQEREQKEYLDNLKETAEIERRVYEARKKDIEDAEEEVARAEEQRLQERKEEIERLKKEVVDTYKDASDEMLAEIENLQKRQTALASKLSQFGGVMEDISEAQDRFKDIHSPFTENRFGEVVLDDLNKQTRELEKYYDTLIGLRERTGMSSELFDTIVNMDYEESLTYAQRLMKLTDEKFTEYIESWQKKQETSKRITEGLFGNESAGAKRILADLTAQTDTLKSYYNMLESVKNRGNVPREFFETLRDMGIDEGLEYANALLELSDEDFAKYIKEWETKQETAKQISKELYRDEADELSNEITNKFKELRKSFMTVGKDSAEEFGKGFLTQLSNTVRDIRRMLNNAFSDVQTGGSSLDIRVPALARGAVLPPNREFLAIVGDQKSGTNVEAPLDTIVEAMNIALAKNGAKGNTEVILEIDGREFGRAVVEQGNRENRRIGTRLVMA